MRDIESNGFAWREAGKGPLVLLLHGLGGTRTAWSAQLDGLADVARVVAWDMPGYGAAAPLPDDPLTFAALSDAVAALLDELGERHAHIVGLSMGGMIAQYVAARHPSRVSSLTLLATSPKFGFDGVTTPESWQAARLAPLDAGLEPRDFAERVITGLVGDDIAPAALAEQIASMHRISAAALRRAIVCLVSHDSRHLLGSISAPTVCIVGSADDETPTAYTDYLVEHIPGARRVVAHGAGHLVPAEAPDVVNTVIREQLAGAHATSGQVASGQVTS